MFPAYDCVGTEPKIGEGSLSRILSVPPTDTASHETKLRVAKSDNEQVTRSAGPSTVELSSVM
jgi:hypothetical protein